MEEKLSSVAKNFTPSPIQELSHLAQRCNAINLAEGFPDFPAPLQIKDTAVSAINSDFNQYRHVQGICDHLAATMKKMHDLDVNPLTDIAICCGQTEAFAAAIFAVIDPGDEVVLVDPSYETYEGCITMAGGVPVYVALDPPQWTLCPGKLLKSFTARIKAIVLNSPHNPTGKVFSKEELEVIAEACCRWDCLAITDEVYEQITFDDKKHISLASSQECKRELSSHPPWLKLLVLQVGELDGLLLQLLLHLQSETFIPPEYFEGLKKEYEFKRDFVVKVLTSVGFQIHFKPQGSIFLFAELPKNCLLSDVEYVKELIKEAGVVAVPGCGFFHTKLSMEPSSEASCNYPKRYVRFAFCRSIATLAAAAQKFSDLKIATRYEQP
ncbi:hypothetical protein SLE2022_242740 [Rubroshorea leprosula]